jgi:hypothetical protein
MPEHEEDRSREVGSNDERSVLRRHARIWLATLSTVVGVATGMFTLRDQVFPAEAGSASAVSVPVYQQQVGKVCDKVNDNDRLRARQDGMVRIRLQRAQTTLVQRNALLDGVRSVAARSGAALASFSALAAPRPLATASHDAEAAWNRNLARLRGYAARLDSAGTRAELGAAIDHLAGLRPLLAADGVKVSSGLERLGGPAVTYSLPGSRRRSRCRRCRRVMGPRATTSARLPPVASTPPKEAKPGAPPAPTTRVSSAARSRPRPAPGERRPRARTRLEPPGRKAPQAVTAGADRRDACTSSGSPTPT